MRSGNKPEFKQMGSSPVKKSMNQMLVEGTADAIKTPPKFGTPEYHSGPMKMTLADQVAAKDAYYGSQTGTPTGEEGGEVEVVKSKRELKKEKKLQKKQDKLDRKKARLDREAQERAENPNLGKAEQFARRVRDWGAEKGKTWVGRHLRKGINTLIDPSSTDVGLMLQAGKDIRNRIKQKATGQLGPEEKLLTGEGGLLGVGKNLVDTIRTRSKNRKALKNENTSPLTKKKNENKKFTLRGGLESDKGERKRRKAEKKISKAMLHAGRAKATRKLRKAEKKIEKAEKHDRKVEAHIQGRVPYASDVDPKRREEHRNKRDKLETRLKKQ